MREYHDQRQPDEPSECVRYVTCMDLTRRREADRLLKKDNEEKRVPLDEALKALGDFGPYQKRVFLLMCLLSMTCGIETLITVFTLATPDHRCKIPELQNDTFGLPDDALLNLSIPWETDPDGVLKRSQCLLYVSRNRSSDPDEPLPTRSTVPCDSWVYDHSTFRSTFTEENNLVCSQKDRHALADTLYMAGVVIGSVVMGMISDRFGRKMSLMLGLLLHVAACVGTAFAPSFLIFAILRFCVGVSNMGVFLSAYVLGLELVGSGMRTMCGSVFMMFWCFGLIIQTGVACGLRTWWHLQLALACPAVFFLPYFWLVAESPRWMLSRNKLTEVNAVLGQVAKINKCPPPPKVLAREESKGENPLKMFTHRTTLVRTLVIFLSWIVVTMVYYGLSLNVGNIGANIYLSFLLSAAAELVGYVLSNLLLDRVGRKATLCGSMIISALACLSTMFPVIFDSPSKTVILLVLSNIGKIGASAAFSIIYLFSAELFPTVARNSLMGASSMIGHLGGVVSPYIAQLTVIVGGKLGMALPLVVMGGSGLGAGLLALLLPETMDRQLPETVEDAVNFGKTSSKESTKKYYFDNGGFLAETTEKD